MMEKHRSFIVVLGLFAVAVVAALVAAACRDSTTPVAVSPNRPPFWQAACNASGECPPPCPSLKMTGGGRIDAPPGGPNKNPPSSHQFQTFGAHVIQGLDQSGNCVIKGSLEWVDHSIRINGRPLNLHSIAISSAQSFPGVCADGAVEWKGHLVVKNNGDELDFTVEDCDNGEPGAKSNDGFSITLSGNSSSSLNGYHLYPDKCTSHTSPGFTCNLTGGNRQFHPTHS